MFQNGLDRKDAIFVIVVGQTHEFIIYAIWQRASETVRYRKKQMDVSFSCVCPVIDNEFRYNIFKVVCGFTATLTMLWRNLLSITGQTHEKLTSICSI